MNDEETGSDWSGDGEALAGPLRGERLTRSDGYVVEWHVWSAYNPGAEVAGSHAEVMHAEVADVRDAATSAVPAGLTFPALSLTDLEGRTRLMTFPSPVNLVILFAAWCPSCQVELPRLSRFVQAHAGQGLSAVGIAIHIPDEDERAEVRRFAAEAGLKFPTLLVDEPAYDRLEALCRSAGGPGVVLPTVFVTDGRGKILSVLRGKEVEGLEGRLRRTLQDVLTRRSVPVY